MDAERYAPAGQPALSGPDKWERKHDRPYDRDTLNLVVWASAAVARTEEDFLAVVKAADVLTRDITDEQQKVVDYEYAMGPRLRFVHGLGYNRRDDLYWISGQELEQGGSLDLEVLRRAVFPANRDERDYPLCRQNFVNVVTPREAGLLLLRLARSMWREVGDDHHQVLHRLLNLPIVVDVAMPVLNDYVVAAIAAEEV